MPRPAIVRRSMRGSASPRNVTVPESIGDDAGQQVERRALARAVRPDEAENAPGCRGKAHVVDGDEAAEDSCAWRGRREAREPRAGSSRVRQSVAALRLRQRRRRRRSGDQRPQAVRRELQDENEDRAEHDRLVIAGRADEQRHDVLQLVAQHGDAGRAEKRAPQPSRAAGDRHQQIFRARRYAERAGADRALEMGVKPAREAREHGGIDEDEKFRAAPRRCRRCARRACRAAARGSSGRCGCREDCASRSSRARRRARRARNIRADR